MKTDLLGRKNLLLKPGICNLNAGSVSPTPTPVHCAREALARVQAEDPVHFTFRQAPALLESSRLGLASYLGCQPQDLLLAFNASYAINTVLRSFPFKAGDEILISDQEYNHYQPLLRRIAAQRGVQLRMASLPLADTYEPEEAELVARFQELVSPRTRMIFFSHVTSPTGLVLPARALCKMARELGIVSFVDGAHAPGHIPVSLATDAAGINADFYAANIHKWMMGAVGSGFLFVRPENKRLIDPLMTSAYYDYEPDAPDATGPMQGSPWIMSHEYLGTRDLTALCVVNEAIRFKQSLGEDNLRSTWRTLTSYTRRSMETLGYRPLTPAASELSACMLAFSLESLPRASHIDPLKAWHHFRNEHAIELAFPVLYGTRPTLRISCAWFNTKDELDSLFDVLESFDWSLVS